ncbi:MAG TPA: alpha-L-fucosidase [Roseiflexaceae bacterium]|nr:alpha-L-fucosidase [Roseiflexaceae bacterium]HMP42011.1 alpha-L-fucosidase [Roseiflexaceae bacterium]
MSQPVHPAFTADWESLRTRTIPDWYSNGKFGIFIHWGVYSVPAFGNEWYPRNMYEQGSPEYEHHLATYGPHTEFGYKDFIPQFTAANFDPAAWAQLFKEAGATFVVPVAEHHDGFALYDCSFSQWTSVHMGPQRDIIGELAAAVRKHGMVFGVSSHRAEHWWFFSGGRKFPSDVQDPQFDGLYGPAEPKETQPDQAYLEDWLARTCELVDKYQPQLVWFDWWIEEPAFEPYLQRFGAHYYNRGIEWGKGVAINNKFSSFPAGTAVFDIERGQLAGMRDELWQNDTSVSKNSWGYIEGHDYKEVTSIIGDLVDVVSKNGALLLNIGPRPDGSIPEVEQAMLREIGRWLAINGEAIYNTRPWEVFGEGPTEVAEGSFTDTKRSAFTSHDIRFTRGAQAVYAICLAWPEAAVTIRSLGRNSTLQADRIASVTMLGSDAPIAWVQSEAGLTLTPPSTPPCDHAFTFKIILK